MVAIITYAPEATPTEFYVRTMRNVDEQSSRAWHHFVYCETPEALRKFRSLLSLRSSEYQKQVSLLTSNTIPLEENFKYVAFHPIQDIWNYRFIDVMSSALEDVDVIVAGVWCRYATIQEVIRHKTISIDKTIASTMYSKALLPLSLASIEAAVHIQGLYYYDILHPGDPCDILPITLTSRVLAEGDILTIPDMLASHSVCENSDLLQFQQARNNAYRKYPILRQ
jgi:hypothetical protein